LNNLKSDTVSLEVVRPVFPQACTIPQETLDNYCNSSNRHASMSPSKSIRYSTASESVSLANPPKGIQRSASLAQRGAPQPRLAEGKNYSCRQVIASRQNDDFSFSGDESLDQCSSITSTDEAFYSQSSGRQSSAMMAPNCVDRRVRAGIANMPRMHLAADYRIRNQFSNLKHYTVDQLPSQQFMPTPRPPLKTSHHILTKSNTINNFSEENRLDVMSLHSGRSINTRRAPSINRSEPQRPVLSVDQPKMRFLPHYQPPSRHQKLGPSSGHVNGTSSPQSALTYQRRRDRSLVKQPLAVVTAATVTQSRRPLSLGYALASEFVESSRRPSNWVENAGLQNSDPDGIVPPPEEFCC